jgi:predicted permease
VRSFANLLRVDPGFEPERAVYLDLYVPGSRYPDARAQTRFYRDLLRALEELPGVEAAGALLYFPYKPKLWPSSIEVEGRPVPPGDEPIVFFNQVAGAYFAAMGIPLHAGRLPTEQEIWESGAPRVVVINRAMAQRLFGGTDPLGHRIRSGPDGAWSEIVGVVGDVRQQRLDLPPSPEYYGTFQTMPMPFQSVVVRGRAPRPVSVAEVREVLRRLDPGVAAANLMALEEWTRLHTRERQFALWVLSAFASLALVLCVVGVYGAVNFGVARRQREMSIRLALGDSPAGIRALVFREGLTLVASGAASGAVLAAAASPLTRRLLYGVSPLDPLALLGVPLALALAAMAACWWPARLASRVHPAETLRGD